MPSALLPPLVAAIEPLAAYCARTPPGNRHADQVEALITTASEYVEAVAAETEARAAQPDWRAIAAQMVAYLEFPPCTNPLVLRVQRHLDSPAMKHRAALTQVQRLYLPQITSHHLGLPDYLK